MGRLGFDRGELNSIRLRGQAVKTSPFHGGNTSSILVGVIYADVAQLAEQLICNQQVIGSSPIIGFNGWIPEWPKGTDCKSAADCFGGSNPPPSSIARGRAVAAYRAHNPEVGGSSPPPAIQMPS